MGWWISSTSIRTFVLRRQGWRSNIFASCISTFTKPYQTSRLFRYSTRTTSGYSSTFETVRKSRCPQTWSEISNFGSNLRRWGTSRKIGKIYEYDAFEWATQGGFTTNLSMLLDIDTRAKSRRTAADEKFESTRDSQASIKVRRQVQQIQLEED